MLINSWLVATLAPPGNIPTSNPIKDPKLALKVSQGYLFAVG